ncbi:MAG: prepilin-type N-terminal cleavage/methylation domain-containing protein [Limisphaerales bacterium]
MRRATPRQGGFTLIELTISAAIGVIVLVASYLCLNAGLATQKVIEPRTDVLQTGRVVVAMMAADLRSACSLSSDYDFVGEHRTLGTMEADNLDFATHFYTPKHQREGDYCQVSYFADKAPKSEHFSLWRRRNPRIAPDPLEGGSREELVRGLRGLRLEYFDGMDWYDSWGDLGASKKETNRTVVASNLFGMPEAVRITLMLDPTPPKKTAVANTEEHPEPPLMFQTVVRLELADVPEAASGPAESATPGNGAATPAQTTGGAPP